MYAGSTFKRSPGMTLKRGKFPTVKTSEDSMLSQLCHTNSLRHQVACGVRDRLNLAGKSTSTSSCGRTSPLITPGKNAVRIYSLSMGADRRQSWDESAVIISPAWQSSRSKGGSGIGQDGGLGIWIEL